MASIRRTLSPVPRPGSRTSGETGSVASPLSRLSSATQGPPPPQLAAGFQHSSYNSLGYGVYKIHAFIIGLFSHRASRSLERSKPKGQGWMKSILHFSICFMVGAFIGLTPFVSMNSSGNLMSNHQTLFFGMVPTVAKYQKAEPVLEAKQKSDLVVSDDDRNRVSVEQGGNQPGIMDEKVLAALVSQDLVLEVRKLLIVVTPTHARPFQAYYLNRLAQTLKLVRSPMLWIVVEMNSQSAETADILRRTGIMYRHLVCNGNVTDVKDINTLQRNVAMAHIETHRLDGIVYFADDNNVYSVDLFEQLRQIRRFGAWKVAKLSTNKRFFVPDGPICNNTGVIGWNTKNVRRRFHAELSGFAFNSTILWDPKRWHRLILEPIRQLDKVHRDFQVSALIEQLVEDESQIEGLFGDCSSIEVWQFPLESSSIRYPHQWSLNRNLEMKIKSSHSILRRFAHACKILISGCIITNPCCVDYERRSSYRKMEFSELKIGFNGAQRGTSIIVVASPLQKMQKCIAESIAL
ncbi:hypothetical protein V2J09_005275 [Rumex salicifolius]